MRQYLVNLTDNIIGMERFDDAMREHFFTNGSLKTEEFLVFIISALKTRGPSGHQGVVCKMKQETLAKVICSFKKINTGLTTKAKDLLPAPALLDHYDTETLMRHMAAACLAHIICDRLDPGARHNILPSYRRPKKEPVSAGNPRKDPFD